MTTRTRRYIDAKVEDAIKAQRNLGRTPKQAHTELEQSDLAARLPTLRTVQRIYRELDRPGDSERWEIGDFDDDPSVIDCLREVARASDSQRTSFTKDQARRIERIAAIAPDIPPLAWFLLAADEREFDVQLFLAMRPWRSESDRLMYVDALAKAGRGIPIPPLPGLLIGEGDRTFWESLGFHFAKGNASGVGTATGSAMVVGKGTSGAGKGQNDGD